MDKQLDIPADPSEIGLLRRKINLFHNTKLAIGALSALV